MHPRAREVSAGGHTRPPQRATAFWAPAGWGKSAHGHGVGRERTPAMPCGEGPRGAVSRADLVPYHLRHRKLGKGRKSVIRRQVDGARCENRIFLPGLLLRRRRARRRPAFLLSFFFLQPKRLVEFPTKRERRLVELLGLHAAMGWVPCRFGKTTVSPWPDSSKFSVLDAGTQTEIWYAANEKDGDGPLPVRPTRAGAHAVAQ